MYTTRIAVLLVLLLAGSACNRGGGSATTGGPEQQIGLRTIEQAKADKAELESRIIKTACQAYYVKHGMGPESLEALLTPPEGQALLQGGRDALIDPWGRPYQYEVKEIKDGITFRVFTQSPDGMLIEAK